MKKITVWNFTNLSLSSINSSKDLEWLRNFTEVWIFTLDGILIASNVEYGTRCSNHLPEKIM